MRTIVKTLLIFVALASPSIVSAADSFCKLTVNGGIGMNGRCTFDEATGEFSDGLLKTACRSGLSECHPDDLEVYVAVFLGELLLKTMRNGSFVGITAAIQPLTSVSRVLSVTTAVG